MQSAARILNEHQEVVLRAYGCELAKISAPTPTHVRMREQVELLRRCEAEQREIEQRTDDTPGWLKALGWADWEVEKTLIRSEQVLA